MLPRPLCPTPTAAREGVEQADERLNASAGSGGRHAVWLGGASEGGGEAGASEVARLRRGCKIGLSWSTISRCRPSVPSASPLYPSLHTHANPASLQATITAPIALRGSPPVPAVRSCPLSRKPPAGRSPRRRSCPRLAARREALSPFPPLHPSHAGPHCRHPRPGQPHPATPSGRPSSPPSSSPASPDRSPSSPTSPSDLAERPTISPPPSSTCAPSARPPPPKFESPRPAGPSST